MEKACALRVMSKINWLVIRMKVFKYSLCNITKIAALVCIGMAQPTLAKDIKQHQDDQRIQDLHTQKQITMPQAHSDLKPMLAPNKKENTVSLSAQELSNYPQLVVRALAMAVLENHFDNVAFLLPYYQQIPPQMQETILQQWASGMLAERDGHYRQAINAYRIALAENNHATRLRLRLALALFANKEFDAAQDQFIKLLSEDEIPQDVAEFIQQHLLEIKRQDRWSVSGGVSFLNDRNINNAPKNPDLGGGLTASNAQSARGLGFNLGINKRWSISHGFYSEIRTDGQGKYYWDNKPYNELGVRFSIGGGYENARAHFVLLPFLEKNYYAGGNNDDDKLRYFSSAKGLFAEWSYWLTPHWQTSLSAEFAKQEYARRVHLNGTTRSVNANVVYLPNAKRYYFVGLNFNRTDTRDADDAFIRRGINIGLGQELAFGFGMRVSANYAQKDYRAVGFFNQVQHNKEYGVSVSLWNKKIHYAGITPRITWQYQRVNSNLPLYEYDKNKIFIEMSRQF